MATAIITNSKSLKQLKLGEIRLGEKLIIADPCYKKDSRWVVLVDIPSSLWQFYVLRNKRNQILMGIRENYNAQDIIKYPHEIKQIAVDSGQAGIYDLSHYNDNKMLKQYKFINEDMYVDMLHQKDSWYYINCDITLNNQNHAGLLPYGAVSESGFGDGVYPVIVSEAGILINFSM